MYKCGMLPSPEDKRDYLYSSFFESKDLPSKYESKKVKIKNQNPFGFCVGYSTSTHKDNQEVKNHPGKGIETSPLFIQYECKQRDGIPYTEGTYTRTAMEVLKDVGVCEEKYMPSSLAAFPVPKPSKDAYDNAQNYKIKSYASLNSLQEIKQAVVNNGTVVIGVQVTDTFMYPERGFIDNPRGTMYGGHAIAVVGYDDNLEYTFKNGRKKKGFLKLHNSWGEDWGDNGYAWLPYDFYYMVADFGMPWFVEAWTSVDVKMPNKPAKELILWVNNRKAVVDGNEVILDQAPIVDSKSYRTLVPIKMISEMFGEKVNWIRDENAVTIGNNVKLWIGKNYAEVNNKKIKLDQPPVVDQDSWRTLVPLKFISEILDYNVDWNKKEKKITIRR